MTTTIRVLTDGHGNKIITTITGGTRHVR